MLKNKEKCKDKKKINYNSTKYLSLYMIRLKDESMKL